MAVDPKQEHDLAGGATLPAAPRRAGASDADATIAVGSAVRPDGAEAADETLVSSPGTGSDSAVIRAGRTDDYQELATIDPARYVIGSEIARGGMGRIVAARDRRLGRTVAIKELLPGSADLHARFEREARITAKLQHPGIVNLLEAGSWPGGEPFYVMKLVAGESLDRVVAKRTTLELRLELVPNIIAVVDALAYAHSQNVIHRDLKPSNVLIGDFGETVVIDWGLAKDLSSPSLSGEDSVRRTRETAGEPDETLAGSILGTPAYMPAEQALTSAVDERADVYALGALLYHVLAGAPPYIGKSAAEILHLVAKEPPPPLTSRAPGAPSDLVTIVGKAMARNAKDRYPTARELADDLKNFQTGNLVNAHAYSAWQLIRRWIRRHRTAVAVASVAVVLLTALGLVSVRRIIREQAATEHERARAENQRELAERSRGAAEDLTSFMLGDLREKLQPLGKLDLLDDVATKAVAYYDLRGDNLSAAELGKHALARRHLGDVLRQHKDGDLPGALRQYRASLEITQRLASAAPADAQLQRDLAVSHDKVGDVIFAQGDAAAALVEYRAARNLREALVAKDPDKAEWKVELAISHDKIGTVALTQGDAPAALAEYRVSLAITESLAAKDPANVARQRDLAFSHNAVGNVLFKQRDLPAALAQYQKSLAIVEPLAAKDPDNAEWQRALSVSHNKLGNVMFTQKNYVGALYEYRADLVISEALAAKDPSNAGRQADLSVTHNKIGNTLLAQNNASGALAEYEASVAINAALVARDPTNADRQRALSVAHNKAGDAQATSGDKAGALRNYHAAKKIIATLAAKDPTNAELQVDVSVSHQRIGDVRLGQGNKAGAVEEYKAGLEVAQRLLAKEPSNADAQEMVTTLAASVATASTQR